MWFALAAVLLTAFFVIRPVGAPAAPLRVIRNSNRAGAYISSLMVGAGMFAMFLFLSIFLQTILGYSPVRAGFAFLPFSVGIILGAGVAANLLPKVGPRPLMIPGLIAGGVGMLLLAELQADSGYLTHVLPAMVIMSLGMAFVFIPTASVLHAIDQHDAGVASAMISTSQQVGGSLGTALMNTVAVTATSSFLVANAAAGPAVMPETPDARFHPRLLRRRCAAARRRGRGVLHDPHRCRCGEGGTTRHPCTSGGGSAGTPALRPSRRRGRIADVADSPGGRPPASIRSIPAPIRTRTRTGSETCGHHRSAGLHPRPRRGDGVVSPFFASPQMDFG